MFVSLELIWAQWLVLASSDAGMPWLIHGLLRKHGTLRYTLTNCFQAISPLGAVHTMKIQMTYYVIINVAM